MRMYVYDIEVYSHDFLVIFKDKETGEYTVIHNDNEAVRDFIDDDSIYFGFNSKRYDQYIIKAIAAGRTPEEIKEINDWIIGEELAWEHPLMQGKYYFFNNVDIMDDMQIGLSLKAIEGHLGLSVKETSVPFDIDRPLTLEELEETILYCKHDVDTTEKLVDLRKDYLQTKIDIGQMAGIDAPLALSMTNAKLTAALLSARQIEHNDERQYVYPACLIREYIPQEVFDFFDRMYNPEISDKDLFSSKLTITIGNAQGVIGYGGIHLAEKNFMWGDSAHDTHTEF